LAATWKDAKWMYDRSRELFVPFMAGSSLPVTWRKPALKLDKGCDLVEAVQIGYGPFEGYGFHALETLQCMVERRKGGETSVKAVTCLTGRDVWKAGDAGQWSWDLLEAALGRSESVCPGDIRRNVGSAPVQGMPATPALGFFVATRGRPPGQGAFAQGPHSGFLFCGKGQGRSQAAVEPLPPAAAAGGEIF